MQSKCPHSLETEQSVIGGLLLDNEALGYGCRTRGGEDFSRPHRLIFEAVKVDSRRQQTARLDYAILNSLGFRVEQLDDVGGFCIPC